MDLAYSPMAKCISTPFQSFTHRPLALFSRVSISVRIKPKFANNTHNRWLNMCSASSSDTHTLVAGHKSVEVESNKEDEYGDLKSWMHENGLPPCKVVIKERPSHNAKHRPIHYVAASEDLQVHFVSGSWFFFVPFSFSLRSTCVYLFMIRRGQLVLIVGW